MTSEHRAEATNRSITTTSRPSKFAHIVLRTSRYEAMRRFYTSLLIAETAFRNDFVDFIRYDDEHHRIVLVNTPDAPDPAPGSVGTAHIAFTYDSLGELLGTHERAASLGIDPVWCINHGITTSIYYQDPDGMMVETQYDNMDNDAADAFMNGPYFAINPLGVDFDPVLLTRRYEEGWPLQDLLRQGSAPFAEDVEPVRPTEFHYDYRGSRLHEFA